MKNTSAPDPESRFNYKVNLQLPSHGAPLSIVLFLVSISSNVFFPDLQTPTSNRLLMVSIWISNRRFYVLETRLLIFHLSLLLLTSSPFGKWPPFLAVTQIKNMGVFPNSSLTHAPILFVGKLLAFSYEIHTKSHYFFTTCTTTPPV